MPDLMYSRVYVTCRNRRRSCLLCEFIGMQQNFTRLENVCGNHLTVHVYGDVLEREKRAQDFIELANCVCAKCAETCSQHKRK